MIEMHAAIAVLVSVLGFVWYFVRGAPLATAAYNAMLIGAASWLALVALHALILGVWESKVWSWND